MPKNTYSGHRTEKRPKKCAFDHWQITVCECARKDAGKRGAGVRVSSPFRWDARDALRRATGCLWVPRQSRGSLARRLTASGASDTLAVRFARKEEPARRLGVRSRVPSHCWRRRACSRNHVLDVLGSLSKLITISPPPPPHFPASVELRPLLPLLIY